MAGPSRVAAWSFPVAALLVVLASGLFGARAGDGWWGDLDKGQAVRLSDVTTSPEAFRGRVLTFTCVFHRQEREFNPLRTRFNSERYDNVSVWPDGKAVWLAEDYEQDFPFLYVARAHAQHNDLLRLEPFTRIEVTGRIEAVLDGHPFVELTSFRVTGHKLGLRTVEAMTRAETYARTADTSARDIAIDNARAALEATPDLAPIYVSRIRARLVDWLRAAGRTDEAEDVARGEGLDAAAAEPARTPEGTSPPVAPPVRPPSGAPTPPSGTPFEPSLPGEPSDTPAPPVPGARTPAPAPAPVLPPDPPPATPAPRAEIPPASSEPFRPSLPGLPADTPAPPVVPERRAPPPPPPPAPAGSAAPAVPPELAAPAPVPVPEVVDPPLPPPPRNGAPPVRKPRLAGVK